MSPTQTDVLETSSVAIVGHTGYVGGTLWDHLPHASTFNSKNIDDIAGTHHDVILCCGLPAAKWWINQHPDEDETNMQNLQYALQRATCKTFVLISTIDVYDTTATSLQDEDTVVAAQHPYGQHRRRMEQWAMSLFAHCVVLRLPGLFGIGLKKNIIYDMLLDRADQIANIVANSSFQWFDMVDLYAYVEGACSMETGEYNLFPEPVRTLDMVKAAFPQYVDIVSQNLVAHPATYNIKTKNSSTGYILCKHDVIIRIQRFVAVQKKMLANAGSRLAVSNLAWPAAHDQHAFRLLKKYGIGNVELAPTRYGTWEEISAERLLREPVASGVNAFSMQAIFYNVEASMFENEVAFCAHFGRVLELASEAGVRRIVFGSPKNRFVKSEEDMIDATAKAVAIFKKLAHKAASLTPDVVICFEPNSAKYGCNFVTTMKEACELVRAVSHPNMRINFDTGNAVMENESVAADIKLADGLIGHVQISMPFLERLRPNKDHADALRTQLPDAVFSLEMKEVPMKELPGTLLLLYHYV